MWRARAGRRPLDAIPRAHKLQQGTELHLPYFLSAWKLRCFPSCKGSSVPKNFSKAMTSFQDRTVYGGGEPGLIIGTGKGERGIWKSSTFPATGSGAAQPQPSPRWEHPKGLRNRGRRANPRDPVLLDFTILIFWKDERQHKSHLTTLHNSNVLWRRGEAPRGERERCHPGTGRVWAQHRPSHGKNQSVSPTPSERVGFPAETPSPKGEQCHKPLTVPSCPSTAQKHSLQRCSPTWRQINVH